MCFRPGPVLVSPQPITLCNGTSADATGAVQYLRCGVSGEACHRYGQLSRSFLGPDRSAVERDSLPAIEEANVRSALLASEAERVSSALAGRMFVVHR